MTKKIQVCFNTNQFVKYSNNNQTIVVIVDILRATTVISTAFENGIKAIIPVKSLEETLKYKNFKNHILAAERNTLPIEGFDYGNSPFHYINANINGKTLVLTTTNGTKAIHLAKNHKVITASFLNIDAVHSFLIKQNTNIIILCSGWKGLFNLEDTIFAGALAKKILKNKKFDSNCDSLNAAVDLYSIAKNNLFQYLENSSYRKRNKSKEIIKDTHFCLNPTITSEIIPIFIEGKLVKI